MALLRADSKVDLLRGLPLLELCSRRGLRRIAVLGDEAMDVGHG